MRLGIISDAHHYRDQEGSLCTLTPLARQFEQWAAIFEEVLICAPLLEGGVPPTHTPYQSRNIRLLPVSTGGGNTLKAKLHLAMKSKDWWVSIKQLLSQVDAVHIRCPNNISILGLLALRSSKCLRQAVYTGTWNGYRNEPPTYRWQRWFLKKHFNGPVAVYGDWPTQPAHIVPSFSPSYELRDWENETDAVASKIVTLSQLEALSQPIKLLTVGALNQNKNQQLVVRALRILKEMNIKAELRVLGDGAMRGPLVRLAADLGLKHQVYFEGRTPHERVREFYRKSDFVIQSPLTEGYGKVPIEAFFHGTIPILSNVCLTKMIVDGSRGRSFPVNSASEIARHVSELARAPKEMIGMIEKGRNYARSITLETWRTHIKQMLEQHWRVEL